MVDFWEVVLDFVVDFECCCVLFFDWFEDVNEVFFVVF